MGAAIRPPRRPRPPPPRCYEFRAPKNLDRPRHGPAVNVSMDLPYYYLSAEDVIPRDAAYVIVCGSVRVVPPGTFRGYPNLARVELQEGVEEIGAGAFENCHNLTCVDSASSLRKIGEGAFFGCRLLSEMVLREGLWGIGRGAFSECGMRRIAVPSSVVEIEENAFVSCDNLEAVTLAGGLVGDRAFAGCQRLSELNLSEGIRRIGAWAFCQCALERITVPSSVVDIGREAFAACQRLSEVNLPEGLRWIGVNAFYECDLRRITVPSSVVYIGEGAFSRCNNLAAATLAGGMVLVASNAFFNCPRLELIAIPSMAIVVEAGEDGDVRAAAVTGGIGPIGWDPYESHRLILASPHLASMHPEYLTTTTNAINHFVGTGLSVGDISGQIRDCFDDHLSRWYKREVATILELGLWKMELGRAARGRETAGADVPTRDECRRTCGADPIVGLVLSALAGPHRRADQGENAGSIQP